MARCVELVTLVERENRYQDLVTEIARENGRISSTNPAGTTPNFVGADPRVCPILSAHGGTPLPRFGLWYNSCESYEIVKKGEADDNQSHFRDGT